MASTREIPRSIRASLYIDGKPAELSIKNVQQKTNTLRRELEQVTYGTEAWSKKFEEFERHNRTLTHMRNEVKGLNGAFGFLKTEIGKIGTLAAGYLGFQFVTEQFQNIISSNAKLSDSLADVRKTTGLSEEGVRRLNGELKKIDTRTSQAQLLSLSEVAGKLGISGEREVLGFVRAADKINVALGKDLGNAEDAINDLGKLTELFKIKDVYGLEEALIRTGSAINSLGAAGSASEAYLVEFTKRMGGIAPQANFSIESILGLATTMDELGQPVEASATAIGQFVVGLGKDIPGFARIAGMSVKEFTAILQKDGNQALIEVLKNLNSTGTGAAGLAEKMGLVGEDGARAVTALGVLANNLDKLVVKQKLANDEFAKGSSLQDEFNIKNATFGAVLDRTGKQLHSIASNTILTDFLKHLVFGFSNLLSWGERNMVMIVNVTKFLIVAATAWGGYRLAVLLANTALEANIARTTLARTATLALAAAKALWAGNAVRAAAAMKLLNVTMSLNPWGAALSAIVAVTAALVLFSRTTSEAQKIQETFNSIEAEAKKGNLEEIERIKNLKAVLDDETASKEKKLLAVQRLNEINPKILAGLSQEEALTKKGTAAIDQYIKALDRKTTAQAAENEILKLKQRIVEIDNGAINETTLWEDAKAFGKSGNLKEFDTNQRKYGRRSALHEKEEKLRAVKAIQERYGADMKANDEEFLVNGVTTGGTSTGGLGNGSDKKAESAKARAAKLFNEAEKERIASLARTEQAIMDNYANELSKTDEHFRKLKEKHSTNAAAVEQLERERAAKINQINEQFRKEDAAKLLSIQNEISQMAAAAMQNDTDRQLAELQNETALKLQAMDKEESEILEKVNKQEIRIRNLRAAGKTDEAKILEDAIARELAILDKSGKLREQFLRNQGVKEKKILEDAANEKQLAELEAAVINSQGTGSSLTKQSYDAQVALLDFQHKLEVANAEKTGKSVAEINARYLANRKQLEFNFENEKAEMILEGAQLVSDTMFSMMAGSRQAASDAEIASIEAQRTKELENKNLTEEQKKRINDKYDKQIKAEKLRAFKADQRAAIAQAIINGLIGVGKLWVNPGFPAAIPLAAMLGAQTAASVAMIATQKPPKYATGGFSDRDPAGYVSQATVFRNSASGRPFEAGEAGREWIAPNWMLQDPRYANVIGMLETARMEKRSFAAGGMTGPGAAQPNVIVDNSDIKVLLMELIRAQREANDKKVVLSMKEFEEESTNRVAIRNSAAA